MKEKFVKYFKGDTAIWLIIFLLAIFSMLTVYSATGTLAYKKMGGNTSYFLFRHLTFLALGIGITFVVHNISYKVFYSLSQLLVYASVPLLAWTMVRGVSLNEAARWITLPGTGLSFQTSDMAKFALIIYVARILSKNQENIEDPNAAFKPILMWVLIICGLILPANFSTAAMLFAICLVLMFIGRIRIKHLLGVVGVGVVGVVLFVSLALNMSGKGRVSTWKARIENFTSGDSEGNYQSNQSKIAIVNGGLFGRGPGNSIQRNFLPHPYSDFIYAIIVEEYGLIGGFIVLLLYLFLMWRVGAIVRKSQRTFPAFLVIGLAFSLVFQALINMGVAVNVFPVTGQTLPFVSMGGTSIMFTSGALGIILSVSRTVQPLKEETEDESEIEIPEDNY
ncbi:MAG: FtsW/RodA/SpoVE family cell cycle protein [Salinivirgaceae bacterium]|jgi:cell division protein FtsW|nr:FtsW/RodA/SpoVE family cell cycle protein [Salinivirgaceae bacterium]